MLLTSWVPSRVMSHRLVNVSSHTQHKDPLCWLEAGRGLERYLMGREKNSGQQNNCAPEIILGRD